MCAQVSSTLYAAMVYAGLPATERHAHSLPVDYLPAGLDATIAGSYLDLKFNEYIFTAAADSGISEWRNTDRDTRIAVIAMRSELADTQ